MAAVEAILQILVLKEKKKQKKAKKERKEEGETWGSFCLLLPLGWELPCISTWLFVLSCQ